jgi:hypothetical protein
MPDPQSYRRHGNRDSIMQVTIHSWEPVKVFVEVTDIPVDLSVPDGSTVIIAPPPAREPAPWSGRSRAGSEPGPRRNPPPRWNPPRRPNPPRARDHAREPAGEPWYLDVTLGDYIAAQRGRARDAGGRGTAMRRQPGGRR